MVQHVLSAGFTSARTDILARFVKFFRSLRTASGPEVRTAAYLVSRDIRTVTGSNLRLIQDESGQDPWTVSPARVKIALKEAEAVPVPDIDSWRVPYLDKLLQQRQILYYYGHDITTISQLIDNLCKN